MKSTFVQMYENIVGMYVVLKDSQVKGRIAGVYEDDVNTIFVVITAAPVGVRELKIGEFIIDNSSLEDRINELDIEISLLEEKKQIKRFLVSFKDLCSSN